MINLSVLFCWPFFSEGHPLTRDKKTNEKLNSDMSLFVHEVSHKMVSFLEIRTQEQWIVGQFIDANLNLKFLILLFLLELICPSPNISSNPTLFYFLGNLFKNFFLISAFDLRGIVCILPYIWVRCFLTPKTWSYKIFLVFSSIVTYTRENLRCTNLIMYLDKAF